MHPTVTAYPSCQHLLNNGAIPRVRIPAATTKYEYVCSSCYQIYMGNSNRLQQTFVKTQILTLVEAVTV